MITVLGRGSLTGIVGVCDVKEHLLGKCLSHKRRRIYGEKPTKSNANHNGQDDIQTNNPHSPQEEVNPNRNRNV